jgi:hypothetical protein
MSKYIIWHTSNITSKIVQIKELNDVMCYIWLDKWWTIIYNLLIAGIADIDNTTAIEKQIQNVSNWLVWPID